MDWIACKSTALEYWKKYRYVLMVLLAGILLMLLPTGREKQEPAQPVSASQEPSLQDSLAEVLGQIAGAGKVRVLLTQAAGEETVYQVNENSAAEGSNRNIRRETVLISGTGREESGLVRQVKAPTYLGAVIVCQGADNAAVRLSIVEAVKSATGLSSDRISVLKMK